MKVDSALTRAARNLGFNYIRDARHGQLWKHETTGRIACIAQFTNTQTTFGYANQLAQLRRAAHA